MSADTRIQQILELLELEPADVFLNYALGIEYATLPETFAEAEKQYNKVIALDENYIAVYYQLGKLCEAQRKNSEALEYYRTGLKKATDKKDNRSINEFGEAIFMLED